MATSEKDLYYLLKTKEIITILDGDTKYGQYETMSGKQISISMPYLSGPDLCGLSTHFGLPVTYSWGGSNLSRWVYLDNLLEHCIENNKCSDLLLHMFSLDQFKNILSGLSAEAVEDAYSHIVDEIIGKINGILFFGGHELIKEGNRYLVRIKGKDVSVKKDIETEKSILNKINALIEEGENLIVNNTYSDELHRTYCETWLGEVNILNERHLKGHPLYKSIYTTFFHRHTRTNSFVEMLGLLQAVASDSEFFGIDKSVNHAERDKSKTIEELMQEDIQRCKDILERVVEENKVRLFYTEITARYDGVITGFGKGLYFYYAEQNFYDPDISIEALRHNILVLSQKMTIFLATCSSKTILKEETQVMKSNKVFIVHGHDDAAKIEMARTLEKAGLEAVILHEQADVGMTIIEKIEKYTDVAFAVILYTECDKGRAKEQDVNEEKYRARQNVVFEHGYLIGKLGRTHVSAFVKGDVETPGDISGVVYTKMDSAGAWKQTLARNMMATGMTVDVAKMVL